MRRAAAAHPRRYTATGTAVITEVTHLPGGLTQPAEAKLTELVRKSPGNVKFLIALATVQLNGGKGDATIATYRRAIVENPRRDESHVQLANAYARLGRNEEARKEFEIVLELSPRSFPAWWGLADLAQKAGRSAEVQSLLTRAVAAGTESPSILKKLAEIEVARPLSPTVK
ncbi:MAG TPA: tetratricopeptide repeat protein [Thermoanaerobaculia bacterium]|nr:tetratricopeptide repeat protein [Thermoanaerobaculia bacterium]